MIDILPQYKEGSDLTLMNVYYSRRKQDDETGKPIKDHLVLVYKDNEAKCIKYEIIYEPEYTYFKFKDGIVVDHNLLFTEAENVVPVTCKYSLITKSIAKECGMEDYYNQNIQTQNYSENNKLHTLTNIFRSDIDIEDYYRFLFSKKFQNNVNPVTKAYFDIEVDGKYAVSDFPEMGECPINAISYLNWEYLELHSFLLRDSKNPLIAEFENNVKSGSFSSKDVQDFMIQAFGSVRKYEYYGFDKVKINIHFYDNEIELITDFFQTVHYHHPDFILGYNSSGFDLQYIIARIEILGYIPADIMCDRSWPVKDVAHFIDRKNLSMFAERGDYTFISGTTIWIDQMIQFASRRKAKYGSYTSFKLDDIGAKVAKVKKLDYSNITNNLVMLPYLSYVTFVLYNMFDVVVQKCIEQKNEDIEYIFAKAIMNNTSYKRVHRQTVYLINRMVKEFDKLGYIIGNNCNRWNEKPDKFAGALVHDPIRTDSYAKMTLNGIPIFIVNNLIDMDYKSLYPNITLQHNISPNTQEGRIIIDEKVYENENAIGAVKYQRSGEFIENMICDNQVIFCHRWFHLADFNEMLKDMNEYFSEHLIRFTSDGQIETYVTNKENIVIISPLEQIKVINLIDNRAENPLFYLPKKISVERKETR